MFNLMIILLSTINSEPKDSNNYKIAKFIIENIKQTQLCKSNKVAMFLIPASHVSAVILA